MDSLLILILYLALLSGFTYLKFRDIMNPAFLMVGSITVMIILYTSLYTIWPSRDYGKMCLTIASGATSFLIGSIMGRVRYTFGKKVRHIDTKRKEYRIQLSKNVLLVLLATIIITAAVAGGYTYVLTMVYRNKGNFSEQLMENNFLMSILLQCNYACTYVLEYTLICDVILHENRAQRFLKVLCIIPMNVVCVICGMRFAIFIELMFLVCTANFIYRLEYGQNKTKILGMVVKAFLAIIVVFVIAGILSSKISSDRNIVLYVLKYLTIGIYGLNVFLGDFSFTVSRFGVYSFNNLYRILNIFGFEIDYTYSTIGRHYYVNETMGAANLYTGFMNLVSDFNFVGMFLVTILLGFISSKFYYRILADRQKNLIFSIISYSSICYLFIAVWIDQNPINMLLSSSFVMRMLIIILILKFLRRGD